jgi:hypothetical protein
VTAPGRSRLLQHAVKPSGHLLQALLDVVGARLDVLDPRQQANGILDQVMLVGAQQQPLAAPHPAQLHEQVDRDQAHQDGQGAGNGGYQQGGVGGAHRLKIT